MTESRPESVGGVDVVDGRSRRPWSGGRWLGTGRGRVIVSCVREIKQKHLFSKALIRLSRSALNAQQSHQLSSIDRTNYLRIIIFAEKL